MSAYTYQEIEFEIAVNEGFYHYAQKVSPAYLVSGTGIEWASLVVHRLPGEFRKERWFVSEQTTGGAIDISETTSRDEAVAFAIGKIETLGENRFKHALARTQAQKDKKWKRDR